MVIYVSCMDFIIGQTSAWTIDLPSYLHFYFIFKDQLSLFVLDFHYLLWNALSIKI